MAWLERLFLKFMTLQNGKKTQNWNTHVAQNLKE